MFNISVYLYANADFQKKSSEKLQHGRRLVVFKVFFLHRAFADFYEIDVF